MYCLLSYDSPVRNTLVTKCPGCSKAGILIRSRLGGYHMSRLVLELLEVLMGVFGNQNMVVRKTDSPTMPRDSSTVTASIHIPWMRSLWRHHVGDVHRTAVRRVSSYDCLVWGQARRCWLPVHLPSITYLQQERK